MTVTLGCRAPPPAVGQNKTALLIANAGCDHFPKLRTHFQEARQLGAALKRIGFEVEMLTDGSQYEMREALFRFEERVRERGGTRPSFTTAATAYR